VNGGVATDATAADGDFSAAAVAPNLRQDAAPGEHLACVFDGEQEHTGDPATLPPDSLAVLRRLDDEAALTAEDAAGETLSPRPGLFRTDTLTESLIALVVLAVVQRLIGFGRSVLVCGWLDPDQLGEWDLANRFFVLAAPLVVLGLPGSFGRYLEHYRQRGALQIVLLRTTAVCLILALGGMTVMLAAPAFIAEQVFGNADRAASIGLMVFGLAAVIAYNYLTEMLTALRLVRVSSLVQFLNSIAFAGLSITFLALWRADAMAIVLAYAGSCLLLVVAAGAWLIRRWTSLPHDRAHVPHSEMWRKLLPFAVWVWVTNLLYNVFEVVDRYMLLHVGNFPDARSLVGQYHSAQVIPVLMVSAAGLLAGMILPHLSRDWEAGRPERVSNALNLTVKILGLTMFTGSVLVFLMAPLLFNGIWHGKYAEGLAMLPLALVSCSWLGLLTVSQMYLWCAERAPLGCVSLAIGLAANVVLNLLLIPHYGLAGAVAATTISNFVVLVIVFAWNRWLGMQLALGTCLVVVLPLAVLLGPSTAVVVLIGTTLIVVRSNWLLTEQEKHRVLQVWHEYRSGLTKRRAA